MLLLGGAALQFDPRAQPLHRDDLILDCEIDQRTPTLIDRRQDRPHPPVETSLLSLGAVVIIPAGNEPGLYAVRLGGGTMSAVTFRA